MAGLCEVTSLGLGGNLTVFPDEDYDIMEAQDFIGYVESGCKDFNEGRVLLDPEFCMSNPF